MCMKEIKPIQLPRDSHPHKEIVEWWYYNGHLWDKKGNRYAFMDCLFKVDIRKVQIPFLEIPFKHQNILKDVYFAHSFVSDIKTGKSWKDVQNVSIISQDSFQRPLLYVNYTDINMLDGYTNAEIAETEPGTFHLKTDRIDLTLISKQKPLLEGGAGYIGTPKEGSYYYSLTQCETKGMIKAGKEWIEVTGKSWMDHQWANKPYSKDKWTWFAIQLEDGTDIMCVAYDNGKKVDYLVDAIYSDGKMKHGKNVIITPGKKKWKSKETGAIYPLTWNIEIPEMNISLETEAIVKDQEMTFRAINYWEGPLDIKARVGNKTIKGVGFMELVGYESKIEYLKRAGKELGESVKKHFFASK